MSHYIVGLLDWKGVATPRSHSDNSCVSTDLEGVPDMNETDEANLAWVMREFEIAISGS